MADTRGAELKELPFFRAAISFGKELLRGVIAHRHIISPFPCNSQISLYLKPKRASDSEGVSLYPLEALDQRLIIKDRERA